MTRTFTELAILFSVVAAPIAVHAQAASAHRPVIAISHPGGFGEHPYAAVDVYAEAGPTQEASRTAIDYPFATPGLVGSVGYGHVQAGRSGGAPLAASMGFGQQSGFAGAWLSYHFN